MRTKLAERENLRKPSGKVKMYKNTVLGTLPIFKR
jgi:hypothetical protein